MVPAIGLIGAWRRQLLRASAAALIAPAAVFAALALLALGGGFGRLGSFSEVFSGPQPGAGGLAATPLPAPRHLTRALAALSSGPVTGLAAAPSTAARSHGGSAPAPVTAPGRSGHGSTGSGHPTSPGHGTTGRPGHGGGSSGHGGSGGGGGGSGGGGSGGGGVTGAVTQVVDGVGAAATAVTSQVPGPIGSAATQAVQTTTSAVSGLLPPAGGLPPSAAPATTLHP